MTTSHPPPPRLTQGHRMQIQLQPDGAATLLRVVDCNVSEKSSRDKKNYQNKIEESPCLSSALASATSTSEVFLCSRPKCWVRDISGQVGKTLNLQELLETILFYGSDCYQVQAQSACCTTAQRIWDTRYCGKEVTSADFSADWEDGRLVPQNNHHIAVWMSASFIDQRERSNDD